MVTHRYDPRTGRFFYRGRRVFGTTRNGYYRHRIKGKWIDQHRLAFLLMGVDIPDGMQVDHINGNKKDNRWSNLRLVSARDNNKNMPLRCDNTSGHVGVSWHKVSKKYMAYIKLPHVRKYLGLFNNRRDAIIARKQAEIKYGYHENHGRLKELYG